MVVAGTIHSFLSSHQEKSFMLQTLEGNLMHIVVPQQALDSTTLSKWVERRFWADIKPRHSGSWTLSSIVEYKNPV